MAPSEHRTPAGTPARLTPGMDAQAAVESLLRTHGARIFTLALRLCKNRADAQDLVQEVFLRAFRRWETFQGRADAGTWLYAIAARSCGHRLRRKGGTDRRIPALSQLMPWNERTVMEIAVEPQGREDPAERAEAISLVQRSITALPAHLRIPLVLKELAGMSVEDTARTLGLASNTVKTRLHRARLALRKVMTSRSTGVEAPAPVFEKQVCLDLLAAKLEAMDRGGRAAGHVVPQAEVCARCHAVFRELDLVQEACQQLASGDIPDALEGKIRRAVADQRRSDDMRRAGAGRRPVKESRPPARRRT
jgi:RNA polymerase sigma-70 factor (ECF subfamily)